MAALVEQTIAYLSTRVQFGEPLSRFQVLRHSAVGLYTRYAAARAMVQELLASDAPAAPGNRALHLPNCISARPGARWPRTPFNCTAAWA